MTKQAELVEEHPQTVAIRQPSPADLVLMFERLATNPDVDVAKFERLLAMQERIVEHNSKAAFNAAFSDMQSEIPTIIERGKTDKGRYARLEDIVDVVRPILQRHGFSLSFRTEWPDKSTVKVVGILTHREGHSRESEFLSAADQSGSKNAIQALGSAVSYGRRYTLKDLLNITSREEDDDGSGTSKAGKPDVEPPGGFEDWLTDLSAVADSGTKALTETWNKSKAEYRKHLVATDKRVWEALKVKAAKAKA